MRRAFAAACVPFVAASAHAQATPVEPQAVVPPEREGLGLIGVATNLAIVERDTTYPSDVFGIGFSLHARLLKTATKHTTAPAPGSD